MVHNKDIVSNTIKVGITIINIQQLTKASLTLAQVWKSVMYMEFEVLFQNEKFKIIEFLGNVYIDIPKEGVPYVSFNNEEKFYPIKGFFSSMCDARINNNVNTMVLFFDSDVSLTEIVDFTNMISAKSITLRPITDADCYNLYIRVLITL